MQTYDFNQLMAVAKTASFEALPVGTYDVEVHEADATMSSTGKPMIKTKFQVVSGPHAPKKIMTQFVLSADNATALNIFFRQMQALGIGPEFFAQLGQTADLTPVAQAMVGRRCQVKLKIRQWQGEDRNEVERVMPPQGGAVAPAMPNALTGAIPAPAPAPAMPPPPPPAPAPQQAAPPPPAPQPQPQPQPQPIAQQPVAPPPAQPAPPVQPAAQVPTPMPPQPPEAAPAPAAAPAPQAPAEAAAPPQPSVAPPPQLPF